MSVNVGRLWIAEGNVVSSVTCRGPGEQECQQAKGRQPGADLEDFDYADVVGNQTYGRGRQSTQPKRQAVEQPSNKTDPVRHQIDCINEDRSECARHYEANEDAEYARPKQVH